MDLVFNNLQWLMCHKTKPNGGLRTKNIARISTGGLYRIERFQKDVYFYDNSLYNQKLFFCMKLKLNTKNNKTQLCLVGKKTTIMRHLVRITLSSLMVSKLILVASIRIVHTIYYECISYCNMTLFLMGILINFDILLSFSFLFFFFFFFFALSLSYSWILFLC